MLCRSPAAAKHCLHFRIQAKVYSSFDLQSQARNPGRNNAISRTTEGPTPCWAAQSQARRDLGSASSAVAALTISGHGATHTRSICLGSLQFHISLIKSSDGIFKNKATAGFYTLKAEASCFVTQHTLLSLREKMGILGDTCNFIYTDTTIIFQFTGPICSGFVSLANSTTASGVSALSLGCLRCTEPEKTGIHLQLGLQELRARLNHTPLDP